jgi:hypothetical protein
MCNYGNATITNCIFSENSGGGMSNGGNAAITNCTFSGNLAYYNGGGMNNGGNATVTNCTFSANSAYSYGYGGFGSYGGGIYNDSNTTIINCIFSGNSAYSGGYYSSYGYGGGIYNGGSSTITNCTFSENLAYGASGGYGGGICDINGTTNIINCILYGDTTSSDGNEIALIGRWSTTDVNYSDIKGGQAVVHIDPCCTLNWGLGNIDADPCFVAPPGNLRLKAGSPCIDAGDNNSVPPDYADLDNDENTIEPTPLDLAGLVRFIDNPFVTDTGNGTPPIVDMGDYEFPCGYEIGDLNNDCKVDFHDLKIMAENWLGSGPTADIVPPPSGDGIVNFLDFAVLAEWWLAGTAL